MDIYDREPIAIDSYIERAIEGLKYLKSLNYNDDESLSRAEKIISGVNFDVSAIEKNITEKKQKRMIKKQ